MTDHMQTQNSSGANTVLLVVVILLLIGGAYWWYSSAQGKNDTEQDAGITLDINIPERNPETAPSE
jgi:hypothetical protein